MWNFSGEPLPKSECLADACLKGLANPGTAFLTKIWAEYGFLLTVMQAWKSLPNSEQSSLLHENPWELCEWVTNVEGGDVRAFRHMFLYFCYPASFERICSRNHKRKIYAAFAGKLEANRDTYKRIDLRAGSTSLSLRSGGYCRQNTIQLSSTSTLRPYVINGLKPRILPAKMERNSTSQPGHKVH